MDFIVIRNNAGNSSAGRPTDDYYLTSACLEYFVARKVRPVFEVYRRVFHKVASGEMTEIEKTQQKIIYANWVVGFLNLNEASKLRIAQEIGKDTGMAGLLPQGINAGTEAPTLHAAKDLLKENNIPFTPVAFNRILMAKGVSTRLHVLARIRTSLGSGRCSTRASRVSARISRIRTSSLRPRSSGTTTDFVLF